MPNAAGIVAVFLFVGDEMCIYIWSYIYIYVCVCVERDRESGCRRILYSLLLRTAPSHLQLLYKCMCCRKIVICVSDGEKLCASRPAHVVDVADGAKRGKKIDISLFFSLLSTVRVVSSERASEGAVPDARSKRYVSFFFFFLRFVHSCLPFLSLFVVVV